MFLVNFRNLHFKGIFNFARRKKKPPYELRYEN